MAAAMFRKMNTSGRLWLISLKFYRNYLFQEVNIKFNNLNKGPALGTRPQPGARA